MYIEPGRRPNEDGTTDRMFSRLGLHRVRGPGDDESVDAAAGLVFDDTRPAPPPPPPPRFLFDNDADVTEAPPRPRSVQRNIGFRCVQRDARSLRSPRSLQRTRGWGLAARDPTRGRVPGGGIWVCCAGTSREAARARWRVRC